MEVVSSLLPIVTLIREKQSVVDILYNVLFCNIIGVILSIKKNIWFLSTLNYSFSQNYGKLLWRKRNSINRSDAECSWFKCNYRNHKLYTYIYTKAASAQQVIFNFIIFAVRRGLRKSINKWVNKYFIKQ